MIDIDTKLFIKHQVGAGFTDYTESAVDVLRDEFSLILASVDTLWIGFRKPINAVYVEAKTANTNIGIFSVSYDKNTVSTPVGNFTDESKGINRSGFVQWGRNLESETASTIDGQEAFWYKFVIDSDSSAMDIYGINLVFADDNSLKERVPYILNNKYLFDGRTNHLNAHVAARNEIIQELRDRQIIKLGNANAVKVKVDQWDILDIPQLREAAIAFALHIIFENASDDPEDAFADKSKLNEERFNIKMRDLVFDLDQNDDGEQNDSERQRTVKHNRMTT